MIEIWRFSERGLANLIVIVCFLYRNLDLCWSLNNEGLALLRFRQRVVSDPFGALSNWNDDIGVMDPCSWYGVECSDGNIVVLNLKDLCLGGALAPELGNLVHLKSIILRNNSFYGIIPDVIGELKDLKLLDLGYNNFSGPLPSDLGNNLSLTFLLLDNNELLGGISPETQELKIISEIEVDEIPLSNSAQRPSSSERSISWKNVRTGGAAYRRLLEDPGDDPRVIRHKSSAVHAPPLTSPSSSPSPSPTSDSPSSSPSPTPAVLSSSPSPTPSPSSKSPYSSPSPSPAPSTVPSPDSNSVPPNASRPSLSVPIPSPAESRSIPAASSNSKHHRAIIFSVAIGGPVLLFAFAIGIFFSQGNKAIAARPWATGLSGQLQKALATGVPKLKRSELEAACEDFSNVISGSSIGTVYKGILSNGCEIAVVSVAATSAKNWSNNLEAQFRKKIDLLSKVNHKNFVNLLGFCEEDEPFTRMMVFEYAPNGTLFEHLHIKEAEHLDWEARMRITMGISYCLDHMHQLKPPVAHKNLNSSAVSLTEDYAAKVSDFGFWNTEVAAAEMESRPESNVYSFGVLLFETVTGRLPYSLDSVSLEDWASDYLRGDQPLKEMVDPTLNSFQVEQLEQISEVIKSCVHPNPKQRPQMREVTASLREITAIGPDGAVPKLSPLWWAELEILSTEAS